MKCSVDISVFSKSGSACGVVTGELDLAQIPRIGETVSLLFPREGFQGLERVPRLNYMFKVERVIYAPKGINAREHNVTLVLEDLMIDDDSQTPEVFRFFEEGFGLFSDPLLEKDL